MSMPGCIQRAVFTMPEHPVIIAAGGTGGHVYPALAVACELRDRDVAVHWVGTEKGLESRVVTESGFPFEKISVSGLRGSGLLARVKGMVNVIVALGRSVALIRRLRPAVVLGMGGYVSGPVCLAAKLCGSKMLVHEQNAVSGYTNRILARFANRVMEAFPVTFDKTGSTDHHSVVHTGNPVRKDILAIDHPQHRLRDRTGPIRILVVGGSQGARALNEIVPAAIAQLNGSGFEICHQAGRGNRTSTAERYRESNTNVDVREFIDDMADAYRWADLVVCRSGAMTVAELAAAGLASILVPYPYAVDDHQTANGQFLCDAGAALIIQESALTAQVLADEISRLCQSERLTLLSMATKAHKSIPRNATALVVEQLLELRS